MFLFSLLTLSHKIKHLRHSNDGLAMRIPGLLGDPELAHNLCWQITPPCEKRALSCLSDSPWRFSVKVGKRALHSWFTFCPLLAVHQEPQMQPRGWPSTHCPSIPPLPLCLRDIPPHKQPRLALLHLQGERVSYSFPDHLLCSECMDLIRLKPVCQSAFHWMPNSNASCYHHLFNVLATLWA